MGALDLAAGTVLAGQYRVVRPLGRGGMGAVYLAVDERGGRDVAVKLMAFIPADESTAAARFQREATATQRLNHPGIVRVYASGKTAAGAPFLVMEYLEGQTLADFTRHHRVLEPAVAATITLEILDALGAAHQHGVLHRDLKPENVMLATRPRRAVVLLDFGISKLLNEAVQLTATGDLLGTPGYMAPEQIVGAKDIGPATDLYSVGVLIFELVAGRLPFPPAGELERMRRLLGAPPPSLEAARPRLDRRLYELVTQLLDPKVSARPQSAAAVHRTLRNIYPPEPARLWGLADTAEGGIRTLPERGPVERFPPGEARIVPPAPTRPPIKRAAPAAGAGHGLEQIGKFFLRALAAFFVLTLLSFLPSWWKKERIRRDVAEVEAAFARGELENAQALAEKCLVSEGGCEGIGPALDRIRRARLEAARRTPQPDVP